MTGVPRSPDVERIIHLYDSKLGSTPRPIAEVAEELGLPASRVTFVVLRARREGVLPPSSMGSHGATCCPTCGAWPSHQRKDIHRG